MDSVGKFAKIMALGKSLFANIRRAQPLVARFLAYKLLEKSNTSASTAAEIENVLSQLAKDSGNTAQFPRHAAYSIAISSSSNAGLGKIQNQQIVSPLIKLKDGKQPRGNLVVLPAARRGICAVKNTKNIKNIKKLPKIIDLRKAGKGSSW